MAKEEMLSRLKNIDFKVMGLKRKRIEKTQEFKNQVSHNMFRRKLRTILESCKNDRDQARIKTDNKVAWL